MRKEITLPSGAKLIDLRHIDCGIQIEAERNKYVNLEYSSQIEFRFFMNVKGKWIMPNEVEAYKLEFEKVSKDLEVAIEYFKQTKP